MASQEQVEINSLDANNRLSPVVEGAILQQLMVVFLLGLLEGLLLLALVLLDGYHLSQT